MALINRGAHQAAPKLNAGFAQGRVQPFIGLSLRTRRTPKQGAVKPGIGAIDFGGKVDGV